MDLYCCSKDFFMKNTYVQTNNQTRSNSAVIPKGPPSNIYRYKTQDQQFQTSHRNHSQLLPLRSANVFSKLYHADNLCLYHGTDLL